MLKALIFDSYYDKHRGVIAYIRLFGGLITADDTIYFLATGQKANVQEVGVFKPNMTPISQLSDGEVGYLVTGLKDLNMVRVGDTICSENNQSMAMAGYKEVTPPVFASIFPIDADDYPKLKDSIAKLKANDASLVYTVENIPALGFGFRCGFLGLLHMDIVQERLSREFDLSLIMTAPSVEYKIAMFNDEEVVIHNPSELPDPGKIKSISEPIAKVEILTPEEYVGAIIQLLTSHRGNYNSLNLISTGQIQVVGEMPLAEMIVDFYDELKSATKGYATMSYETIRFQEDSLVKVDILVNHQVVEPLAVILHSSLAESKGRDICEKLKELIPRQLFEIPIQAAIGARVIARTTIKALRKDVTAKLYGGDVTRRRKLLEKQKKGKKKMKSIGNVDIPQEAFMNILKK